MALWGRIFGQDGVSTVGGAIRDVAEVFVPNASKKSEQDHDAFKASLDQFAGEFELKRDGQFHAFVDGMNRLPRPCLALGTLGLFAYSMVDPVGFSDRMRGIALVPDPLWWLLGAIVSFYFGARELHYVRRRTKARRARKPKAFSFPDPASAASQGQTVPATPATSPMASELPNVRSQEHWSEGS